MVSRRRWTWRTAAVVTRLFARQAELEVSNRERAAAEREKVERFYAYRAVAATRSWPRCARPSSGSSASEDPEVQRIIPVWRKNLETAERSLANVAEDRDRRLAALAGRDVVTAQHEALTASFVDIVPDPKA